MQRVTGHRRLQQFTSRKRILQRGPVQLRGFSLIELMVALVILGILSVIAIPSYQDSVRKTRRSDAKISLMESTQLFERCFSEFGRYEYDATSATTCPQYSSTTTTDGYYQVTVTHATTTSFSLTAVAPSTSPQFSDVKCRSFTITQSGLKTSTDSSSTASTNCW